MALKFKSVVLYLKSIFYNYSVELTTLEEFVFDSVLAIPSACKTVTEAKKCCKTKPFNIMGCTCKIRKGANMEMYE